MSVLKRIYEICFLTCWSFDGVWRQNFIQTYIFPTSSSIDFIRKKSNFKKFTELFHDHADALDMINSLFTFHLIPTLLGLLLIDTFGIYGIAHISLTMNAYSQLILASFYMLIHLLLKTVISLTGHSTTQEAEHIRVCIGKVISSLYEFTTEKNELFDILKHVKTRNLKLQTVFFTINWKIVFGVS